MNEHAGPEFWEEGARQVQDVGIWYYSVSSSGAGTVLLMPGETLPDLLRRHAAEAERRRRIAAAMRGKS